MRFDEALSLFPDEYFDFIYIDGYAHTGQDNGKTLTDWWPKLKKGGVFSGDDYHSDWPNTMRVVNEFTAQNNLKLNIFKFTAEKGRWSNYPSWYTIKE